MQSVFYRHTMHWPSPSPRGTTIDILGPQPWQIQPFSFAITFLFSPVTQRPMEFSLVSQRTLHGATLINPRTQKLLIQPLSMHANCIWRLLGQTVKEQAHMSVIKSDMLQRPSINPVFGEFSYPSTQLGSEFSKRSLENPNCFLNRLVLVM